MNFLWKCLNEDCDDDAYYRFPGLCRVCTNYDDKGQPFEPVQRIKHNPDKTLYIVLETHDPPYRTQKPITRKEIQDVAAEQKKAQRHKTQMRKKRQEMRKEAQQKSEHIHDEHCGHGVDFSDIGESVGEEE